MAVDERARGSDVARSHRQFWMRRMAKAIVGTLRLNDANELSTEIVQAIEPVATIDTPLGPLRCVAGHGRLVWRARTFFEEEPQTVACLDELTPDDVYWDVGANVGLYAVYAARFRGCRTFAFEPEAQNFALLVQNIALNGVGERCLPLCLALSDHFELGRLRVRYITRGGAYNLYRPGLSGDQETLPASMAQASAVDPSVGLDQGMFACSVDELVARHGLPAPTCLKIDVDSIEPMIVRGALETIRSGTLRRVIIELNTRSDEDMAVPRILEEHGFSVVANLHNRSAEGLNAVTMVFKR